MQNQPSQETPNWNDLSPEEAEDFINNLARRKTAKEWEAAAKKAVPHIATHTTTSACGRMWMGMWMAFHRDEILSGDV